jgi:hypothetical protein
MPLTPANQDWSPLGDMLPWLDVGLFPTASRGPGCLEATDFRFMILPSPNNFEVWIMNKITFAIASVSMAIAGVALADAPPAAPGVDSGSKVSTQFSSVDTNKDGRISRDEVKANAELNSSFTTLDSDHDSYLSETEYGKWKSPSMAPAADSPKSTSSPTDSASEAK